LRQRKIHAVAELVAAARKRPITFGLVGVGTPIYLTTEKFLVPTSIEAGYPKSDFNFWIGVFAPR
jgi:hypothetical protein